MTSPDPMKECCQRCVATREMEPYDYDIYCHNPDCECHKSSPAGWVEFEKTMANWLVENVASPDEDMNWWGYDTDCGRVLERLEPFKAFLAHRDAALVEKVLRMKSNPMLPVDDALYYRGDMNAERDAALDAVISLITNREKV